MRQVQSLSQEDALEEEMATIFSLAWRIPMDKGAWQATVHRVTKSRTQLSEFTSLHFTSREPQVRQSVLLWEKVCSVTHIL